MFICIKDSDRGMPKLKHSENCKQSYSSAQELQDVTGNGLLSMVTQYIMVEYTEYYFINSSVILY